MNFFESQDNARRKTTQLALLFTAAVISLVVLTNLLVAGVLVYYGDYGQVADYGSGVLPGTMEQIPAGTWAWISFGVIGVIAAASLYKYLLVRRGGRAIAEALGGRPLTHESATSAQKRLLNVVEEMAIASGVPVPPVYLLPEPGINAFAAGFGINDAVIGVNQGTVDHLDRDELQGVIAHEFSHILNGDTSINLRLIAILHGIMFLGILGYIILRGGGMSSGGRKSSGGIPLLVLALGLIVIGAAGTFFGRLIKAGVSRQREFLADAASVQFTRNPDGIAGALKKIGGLSYGSTMVASKASEASHMFFGQAIVQKFGSMLATHPPLEDRIRAVEPRWDGTFPTVEAPASVPDTTADAYASRGAASGFQSSDSLAVRVASAAATPDATSSLSATAVPLAALADLEDIVGRPTPETLETGHARLDAIEPLLSNAAHDPWAARALTYALLVDREPGMREHQFGFLDANADHGVGAESRRLFPHVSGMTQTARLTLLEMSIASLKLVSDEQYRRFVRNLIHLIKLDAKIELFEWVLHRVLVNSLKPHFEGPRRNRIRHHDVASAAEHTAVLISAIANHGHDDHAVASAAYQEGAELIGLDTPYAPAPDPNFALLNGALRELRALSPLAKPKLLKACVVAALQDELLTEAEQALLQGVAATLDCPLPPLAIST